MMNLDRRDFLQAAAMATIGLASQESWAASNAPARFKKAVKYHMVADKALPAQGTDTANDKPLSVTEKFSLVKKLGFDGLEIHTRDKTAPQKFVEAHQATGLPIHGVLNSSNPDIRSAVDLAKTFGATSVLVVAGRVDKNTSYDANYREWSARLKENAPYAEEHGVKLLVENVWNNFLLSPMEMARFIDEIDSPAVGVYFDVGNVVRFGYPEQWIRILGSRIGKLDIKEYSRVLQKDEGLWKGFQVEIGDGDVDYPAVLKALEEIDYRGWATAEVKGGDADRLAFIAGRMNQVLNLD